MQLGFFFNNLMVVAVVIPLDDNVVERGDPGAAALTSFHACPVCLRPLASVVLVETIASKLQYRVTVFRNRKLWY